MTTLVFFSLFSTWVFLVMGLCLLSPFDLLMHPQTPLFFRCFLLLFSTSFLCYFFSPFFSLHRFSYFSYYCVFLLNYISFLKLYLPLNLLYMVLFFPLLCCVLFCCCLLKSLFENTVSKSKGKFK